MPASDTANSHDLHDLRSIRSSCDRCRLQKLKCTVLTSSDDPGPCERCTKAKVPCFFGRRRRAHHSHDAKKRSAPLTAPVSTYTSLSPARSSPGATASDELRDQIPSTPPTMATVPDLQLTGTTECVSETTTAYNGQSWDDLALGQQNRPSPSIERGLDGQIQVQNSIWQWEWLQHSFNLDSAHLVENNVSNPSGPSPPPNQPSAPNQPTIMGLGSNTAFSLRSSSPGLQREQNLVALISDMQNCMKTLQEGPWQLDSSRSLDDYPVGAVLHLFQDFTAVASPVFSNYRAKGEIMETPITERLEADSSMLGAERGPGDETTTTLLALCGYMLLVRIYSIVLGHFQNYLGRLPSSNSGHSGHGRVAVGAKTMQLSELPCASAAPDLGRIHTAVRMLLNALQGVEQEIGRGGAVARNLVVTRLTQEAVLRAGELQDGCGGLGEKVDLFRDLLREKMGL